MRTFILVPIGALALASCLAEFPRTSQPSATASLHMLTLSFAWSQTQIPIPSTSTAPSATATLPPPSATPTAPAPLAAGEHLVYAQYQYPGIKGDPYLMQFKLAPVEDLARARTLPSAYEGSMAPDGHRFAFINGEGAWIYEVTTEQVTPIHLGEDGKLIQWNTCTTPAWSPGGSRFLTNCRRLRPFEYLVLIEFMPSTGVGRIVPGTEGCLEPTFSPSDTIVIAECIDPNGLILRSNNLFVIDLEFGPTGALPRL